MPRSVNGKKRLRPGAGGTRRWEKDKRGRSVGVGAWDNDGENTAQARSSWQRTVRPDECMALACLLWGVSCVTDTTPGTSPTTVMALAYCRQPLMMQVL
jgi:hypothetical protein